MNPEEIVGELFQLDEDIRWVGIVDQTGRILQNVQRPGVESLTDEVTEQLTLKEFPTIMGLFWRDLLGRSGELKSLLVCYTRVYLFAFYVEKFLVLISFELTGMPRVVQKIESKYGSLMPISPDRDDAA